jgi:hypothetical protein
MQKPMTPIRPVQLSCRASQVRGVDVIERWSPTGKRIPEERAQTPDGPSPLEQVRREREEYSARQ